MKNSLALKWEEYLMGPKSERGVLYGARYAYLEIEVVKGRAGFKAQITTDIWPSWKPVRGAFGTWREAAQAGESAIFNRVLIKDDELRKLIDKYYKKPFKGECSK